METYLFKFSACLAIFWLVYVLFLERQAMHRFKRFYLLGAFAAALIIPNLTITHYIEPIVTDFEMSPMFIPMQSSIIEVPLEVQSFWNLKNVLWLIYGLGALVFSARFIINLVNMYIRISKNTTLSKRSFIYVLLNECRIPHSFFKYIFFNKSSFEADAIPKEVLLHEETHARQLHSIDIIVVELLQIVFWFHPLVYILKHHIKLNHEFLADQAVLNNGIDTKNYQTILLQFSSNTDEYKLSSAINYSSIKKRFTVMKTQTSKTRIWLSSLLILPVIAILFYSFAEKEYIEKENTDILQNVKDELQKAEAYEIQYLGSGASEKLMQEYKDFITEYTNTNTIFGSKYERAIIIYDQIMSDQQRSTVEKYPKRFIPEPNLSKTKPRKLSSAQYEAFKNAEQYAIWIDGKHVSNSMLSNYSANDFVHYSGSIVHKNARSEKFPQPNQYHLYTKAGFKATYQDSQLNRYKKATAKYSNAISVYLKGYQTDNSELKILKAQANKIYKTFTAEELKKHTILPAPPVPAQKSYASIQKPIMWILINRNNQFLVDDEVGTLESIENKLKKLTKEGKTGQLVSIKYDKETSKDVILKVERLVKLNKFKLASFDASKIPPPPPPPSKKTKGGPNHEDTQNIYNPSFLDYIIEMEQLGASFYLDDEKISTNKAKSIANSGQSTEMITQKDANGNYVVKLSSSEKNKIYARSITLRILNNGSYLVDGIKATKRTFVDVFNQLHKDLTPEIRNNIINIHVSSSKEISNKETWFIYNALQDYGFYRIVTPNQDINRAKGNTPFAIESHISNQQKLLTKKEIAAYNIWAKKIHTESKALSKNATFYPPIDEQKFIKFKKIYNRMSQPQKNQAVEFPFPGLDVRSKDEKISISPKIKQQKATKEEVVEYNKLANHCNSQLKREFPIIKVKDVKRIEYLYSKMSEDQKKNAESYPDFSKFPRLPLSPATGFIEVNGEILFYVHYVPKRFYNKKGYLVDKNGKTINGNTQVNASDILPGQYITRVYQNDKVMVEFKDNQPNRKKMSIDLPPPPPPPYHRGTVSKSMINTYNQWIKGLKNTDGTYNIITKEDYTYYISIYNNMTEEQKKNSTGLPPPPPPPSAPKSKQNKEEEREIPAPPPPPIPENVSAEERARMINVTEAYAKKHPESVTKAKISGKIVDVVEMPMDDEGTTEIFGKKYKYIIKDGITTYFDSKNKKYTEDEFKKHIRTIKDNLKETKRSKNDKGGPNTNNSEYIFTDKAPESISISGSKDLIIRKLILKMSNNQTKPMLYKLNNYNSSASEIKKYLEKNPQANITFKEGKENVLHFYDKTDSKMSEGELQNIYSAIFKTYSEKGKNKIYYHKID